MNASTETLGRRIARLRLEHGMTQERLADLMNVSAQAVSKWENNQSYPDIMLLPELSRVFGVTVDELLGVAPAEPASAPESEIEEAAKAWAEAKGEICIEEEEPEPEPVPAVEPAPVAEAAVEPAPVAEAAAEPASAPEPEPAPARKPRYSATPLGEALRAAREAAENPKPQPEPEAEPQPEPEDETAWSDTDYVRATKLRIHVIGAKGDMVNLTIPLGVTRFLANIAGFLPADALNGVDLPGIIGALSDTAPGTLVDVYDENADEHVLITLE